MASYPWPPKKRRKTFKALVDARPISWELKTIEFVWSGSKGTYKCLELVEFPVHTAGRVTQVLVQTEHGEMTVPMTHPQTVLIGDKIEMRLDLTLDA